MPGASFQVTVRNPTDQPLQTTVLFDAQWLAGPAGADGGVPIEVPPQGSQVLTLSAKPSRTPGEASVSLASGGGALSLRIRPAGAEAMPEAEAPAAPTPDR
jgi:hypothetical protein